MSETMPADAAGNDGGASGGNRVPAVEGWFTAPGLPVPDGVVIATDGGPRLVGSQCGGCGTYAFPPRSGPCPNPACDTDTLAAVALSPVGRVWSYTENHYAPPAPYVAADPFEPYALAAVELEAEGMVVLGQVARGVGAADLRVGMSMRLGIDVLFADEDGTEHLVWVWEPDGDGAMGANGEADGG